MYLRKLRGLAMRLAEWFGKEKRDRELAEEMESHLQMHIDDNLRAGMSEAEAQRHARIKLGGIAQTQEAVRRRRGLPLFEDLWQDLRYATRGLLRQPAFTLVAVVTLALGIGANTAIFSVVNAVLLRPLPYANADELVLISRTPGGEARWPFSPGAYLDLKSQSTVLTDVAALSNKGWPANLTGRGEPERLQGFQISANLFPLLGVNAAQGRNFSDAEDRPGANLVVILSHELWERRFGGDPRIIGQTITLNGGAYSVIGVMPANFRYFTKADVWTPLAFMAADENDTGNYLEVIGRLRPGITIQQAAAEVETIVSNYRNNRDPQVHAVLTPPQARLTEEVRPLLLLLIAAVVFILLIACVNIANLLLARGSTRRRELAIRSALGAGRGRVTRQLLTESLVLAFAGGAGGLLMAHWAINFLASGLPEYLADANSHVAALHVDRTTLAFTLALSLLTSILFGLAPALRLSRVDLNETLKEGGRTAGTHNRLLSTLVVAEVALAMVLLIGGGLMIKSFWRLAHVDPGYEPAGVLTAKIDPSGERFKELEQVNAFYSELLERVAAVPGVSHAGLINSLNASTDYGVAEHTPLPAGEKPSAQVNQVSPGYFGAMGIPLQAGRLFTERDTKGATPVVIISETLAQQAFPDENPVGKHLRVWGKPWEIVGVVGAARYWSLTDRPSPHVYFSYLQENWHSMTLVVRAAQTGNPMNLIAPIRSQLAAIDRNQPIHSFKTQEAILSSLITPQKFTTSLLAGFAALAAVLASIGLYGVISYMVSQRNREIGIRLALGADRATVMRMVMRQGLTLVTVGIGMGLAASFLLTRLLVSLLFGTSATDPTTFIVISLALIGVTLGACFVPARRATKVDPVIALRNE